MPAATCHTHHAACQILRIISFTVTQLPAPNYHCRLGRDTAVREMPKHWWGHVVVDVGRQSTHGCGDLIFSSHTTFVLVGVLTFTEYGQKVVMKVCVSVSVCFGGAGPGRRVGLREAATLRACLACLPLTLTCTHDHPSPFRCFQVVGWVGVAFMSLCIIASRKHYSVDVVVAW